METAASRALSSTGSCSSTATRWRNSSPISGPIDRKPTAYYRAFAYVETDDGDLTYFILHQLGVLEEALLDLLDHLKRRAKRQGELARAIAGFEELNHRQRALMQEAARHPLETYTIEGHATATACTT
jgi:Fic family protein